VTDRFLFTGIDENTGGVSLYVRDAATGRATILSKEPFAYVKLKQPETDIVLILPELRLALAYAGDNYDKKKWKPVLLNVDDGSVIAALPIGSLPESVPAYAASAYV